MKDVILAVAVLAMFAFGFVAMGKLDIFLDGNRKVIEKENETKEPSCIMLTEELSFEEITEEIKRFQGSHEKTVIILYDSITAGRMNNTAHYAERKQ